MLGKLVKEECKSYCFPMGIVLLSGMIFTIFLKAICMIPYTGEAKDIIQVLAIMIYVFVLAAMSIAVQVLLVVRFYSTMVGDRGYLTWTLPATSATHIGAKLMGSAIWKLLVGIAMAVMLVIFFVGNYWSWQQDFAINDYWMGDVSLGMMIKYALDEIVVDIRPVDIVAMILNLISSFIWSIAAIVLIYLCIAIGQLFGKWRIIASIGSYFAIIIALQVISTIVAVLEATYDVTQEHSAVYYETNMADPSFVTIAITLVAGLAACAGLFAITNYIFKNHLNLE